MTLSAEFTTNGSAAYQIHATTYGATVNLALQSLTGVHTIQWSVSSTSHSSMTAPTITAAGSPTGSTASFTMVADPGGGEGRALIVKCIVTDSGGATAVATHKIAVANTRGYYPLCVDEELEASSTHGWTAQINSLLAGLATMPALVNPTDDGKIPYASAGVYTLTSAVKTDGSTYIAIGADPADSGAVRLPNGSAGAVNFEASPAGTDVIGMYVDSGEILRMLDGTGSMLTNVADTWTLQRAGTAHVSVSNGLVTLGSAVSLALGASPPGSGTIRLSAADTVVYDISGNSVPTLSLSSGRIKLGYADTAILGLDILSARSDATLQVALGGSNVTQFGLDYVALQMGSPVAATGNLRLRHSFTVRGRTNAGADADVINWGVAANDRLDIGSAGVSTATYGVATGGEHNFLVSGMAIFTVSASTVDFRLLEASFGATNSNPLVRQGTSSDATDTTTRTFEIAGQNKSGNTSTIAGHVLARAGDATGAGGTHVGGTYTVRGGDATGASGTRTGGGLDLRAGTGATANGSLRLLNSSTERIKIDGTGMAFFGVATVAQQTDIVALTDNSTGSATSTLATLPTLTNSPVDADALRDDIQTNWKPALENWIASLAAKVNGLRTRERALGFMA